MIKIEITKEDIKIGDAKIEKYQISELQTILGDYRIPETEKDTFIWDELGLLALTENMKITDFLIEINKNPDFNPKNRMSFPLSVFSGEIYIGGKLLTEYLEKDKKNQFPEFRCGKFKCQLFKNDELNKIDKILIEISNVPPDKYAQKKITDEALKFTNFNFKLAVMQVLMYEKKIIDPKFDAREFADWYDCYKKREIDIDEITYRPIKEIKKYFQDLQIEKKFAYEITELDFEAGSEIYQNIAPSWDGEDDLFKIKKIDEEELKQFTNLKKAGGNLLEYNDELIGLLKKYNVEVI